MKYLQIDDSLYQRAKSIHRMMDWAALPQSMYEEKVRAARNAVRRATHERRLKKEVRLPLTLYEARLRDWFNKINQHLSEVVVYDHSSSPHEFSFWRESYEERDDIYRIIINLLDYIQVVNNE